MPDFLPVRSARLLLRPLRPDDAPTFAAYRSDPDVARYQSWSTPYSLTAANALIDSQAGLCGPTAGRWIQIAVTSEDRLVGDVAVELSGDGHTATIGYTVAADHQGRGFAVEAVGTIVERLFSDLGVHRVQASLDPRNIASARVVEHLGFEREGVARSSVLHGGEWTDDASYALTAEGHRSWTARPVGPPDEVRLVEITPDNAMSVLKLRTHPTQERFVATMAQSFGDALAPEVVDGAPVIPWMRAIEADGELAGFLMLAERTPAHPEAYLWRLLIDRRHQRRGIAKRAMVQLCEQLRADGHRSLLTSWVPAPGGPAPFYLGLGFRPTGELDHDEVVARISFAHRPTDL